MSRWILITITALSVSYGAWSFYVANRYQALCELSYWSATSEQLKLCDERMAELEGRR